MKDEFLRMTVEEIENLPPEMVAQLKDKFQRQDMRAMIDFAGTLPWRPERFALACLNTYMAIACWVDMVPAKDRRLLLGNGKRVIEQIEELLRKEES